MPQNLFNFAPSPSAPAAGGTAAYNNPMMNSVGSSSGYSFNFNDPNGITSGKKSNFPSFGSSLINGPYSQQLNRFFGLQNPITSAFLNATLTPGMDFSQAQTAAQGQSNQLFMPGGQVAQQIAAARGDVINKGFAPSSADRSVNGILNQATQTVGNTFAQGATSLESQRLNLLGGLYGQTNQSIQDILDSMFTGAGSIGQYGLAQSSLPSKGILGLGIGPF